MLTSYRKQHAHPFTISWSISLVMVLVMVTAALLAARSFSMTATTPAVDLNLSELGLSFVPNSGQVDPSIHFQVNDLKGTFAFKTNEIVLTMPGKDQTPASALNLSFEGANPSAKVIGVDQLPGVVNFLVGDDPQQWRTNLPTFSGILYYQLYPGIDLVYDGTSGILKGTYTVAPGADPSLIRWSHSGASEVRLEGGNLILGLGGAILTEDAPVAWQEINGQRMPVRVNYVQNSDGSYGFAVSEYNKSLPLTIDPTLIYSTLLGGSSFDIAGRIVLDADNNVYIAGETTSADFPVGNAFQETKFGFEDAFVMKISADGQYIIYSTYLGGHEDDAAYDIAVDVDGNLFIVGGTDSSDFPTLGAVQANKGAENDAFVAKLNADGSALVYSTFLGGNGFDEAEEIALYNGSAIVAGSTDSSNFPTTDGAYKETPGGDLDGFVVKLSSDGSDLDYSTLIGGSDVDIVFAVAVDGNGNAYLTGVSDSTNFHTVNAYQSANSGNTDAFVAKLNNTGSALHYSTLFGGSDLDTSYDIAIDGTGSAYITGNTSSVDFPIENAVQGFLLGPGDAYAAKLTPDGSGLVFSTYLGGSGTEYAYGLAVNDANETYIVGNTGSADFPLEKALQTYAGNDDAFVTKLSADGDSLEYSTFLGGSDADFGDSIALNNTGQAYVAGVSFSAIFPGEALSASGNSGGSDLFIAVLDDAGEGIPNPNPQDGPNLSGSVKSVSQPILGPDTELTYTIRLVNSGNAAASVDVSDTIPELLTYVPGSASGATYQSGSHKLLWNDVQVGAGSSVSLTFKVTQRENAVFAPAVVINKAIIVANGQTIERIVAIVAIPEALIGSNLSGSFKASTQLTLAPGEVMTYTIMLTNSGMAPVIADVEDPVPAKLAYVGGSVSDGGTYDAGTKTVSWDDVMVPPGAGVPLTFMVTPSEEVSLPVGVHNKAHISYEGITIERSNLVILVPDSIEGDDELPVVTSVEIGDADVLTDRDVTLHISAYDNVQVKWMYIREWELITTPYPHWEIENSSGWVPYQSEYPWKLGDQSGVHFVGVWVVDSSLNHSMITQIGLDFASLILPGASLGLSENMAYVVNYEEGVDVTATLTPTAGDADLYVWHLTSFEGPAQQSVQPGSAVETVTFTTPRAGPYLFIVHGYTETTYNLSITPGGGGFFLPPLLSTAGDSRSTTTVDGPDFNKDLLVEEPVLSKSGFDPLGGVTGTAPKGPYRLYIPVSKKH